MKKYLIAAVISLVASNALAVSRYEITNVTCETVQALIRTEGSVILVYRSTGISACRSTTATCRASNTA